MASVPTSGNEFTRGLPLNGRCLSWAIRSKHSSFHSKGDEMSEKSLDDRVMQLEELVSHQERLLDELNSVVVRLRAEHDAFRLNTKLQVDRLVSRFESQAGDAEPDEKPPHY
jgi:uncharacterized coiled-coil protein SlyX